MLDFEAAETIGLTKIPYDECFCIAGLDIPFIGPTHLWKFSVMIMGVWH